MSSESPRGRQMAPESVTAYERIRRHDLYMEAARLYARRSTCRRAHVGAVAVRDGRIIAAGYNGAPSGTDHCLDMGCIMEGGHCIRAVHAEANLISWAARTGTSLAGAELVCTLSPCSNCAKLILNAGIVFVTYEDYYPDKRALQLLRYIGISQHGWVAYAPGE